MTWAAPDAQRPLILASWIIAFAPACQTLPTDCNPENQPNVIIILVDDLGWGDTEANGALGFKTPQFNRLAAEGLTFGHAYVPQPVCTPARAALLTGCHPMRLGLGQRVIFPYSTHGLHPSEETLAESLGALGYQSACIGKWHLGHAPEFMPLNQGFDEFYGIPYSNDMDAHHYAQLDFTAPDLPLVDHTEVIERSPNQAFFTQRFTDAAISFIQEHHQRPFFLYLAQPMPHRPIHASPPWINTSPLGLYGDVVQELDHSVGRILDELERLHLSEQTLVVFTSDNGPWRSESTGGLRGKKNTTWEGGVRVPMLARWRGKIPAGTNSDAPVTVMDLKPTLEAFCGVTSQVVHDGQDMSSHWLGGEAPTPKPIAFYRDQRLQAIRVGQWKLHLFRPEWQGNPHTPLLFCLQTDPNETTDLAHSHPGVVDHILGIADGFRSDLGDRAMGAVGTGTRPAGQAVSR